MLLGLLFYPPAPEAHFYILVPSRYLLQPLVNIIKHGIQTRWDRTGLRFYKAFSNFS